jgi:site-specific DNA recombinase
MDAARVAIYARVFSDHQAEAKTIASQVADLQARIQADGFELAHLQRFLDEGWSGATLSRPALEQLRDQAAAGALDVL